MHFSTIVLGKNIYDDSLGALRIKAIDVHKDSGRLVVASSSNGAFYVDLRK